MTSEPIETARNGRTTAGKFGIGNRFSVGHSSKSKRLRAAMLDAITEEAIEAVVLTVLGMALDGDISAAKLIFSFVGPPSDDAPSTEHKITITPDNFEEVRRGLLARCN